MYFFNIVLLSEQTQYNIDNNNNNNSNNKNNNNNNNNNNYDSKFNIIGFGLSVWLLKKNVKQK